MKAPKLTVELAIESEHFSVVVKCGEDVCHAVVRLCPFGSATLVAANESALAPSGLRWAMQWHLTEAAARHLLMRTELFDALERWGYDLLEQRCDPESPPWRLAGVRFQGALTRANRLLCAHYDGPDFRVARSFNPEARAFVFSRLRNDRTGRLRQLVQSCPGAFIIGSQKPFGRVVAEQAWVWAVTGRPLGEVLDLLLSARLPESASGELRARRRLLVRRAGVLVAPHDLEGALRRTASIPLVPEDIPSAPLANATWYRVRAATGPSLDDPGGVVTTFASQHPWVVLKAALRRVRPWFGHSLLHQNDTLSVFLGELRYHARATGRRPDRRSNTWNYLREACLWLDHNLGGGTPAVKLERFLKRVPELGLGEVASVELLSGSASWRDCSALALPTVPFRTALVPGLEMTPISSISDLYDEGARMRHCVVALLPELIAGELMVFKARALGHSLTISIRFTGGGHLALDEVRGADDRPPSETQLRLVKRWLELSSGGVEQVY